MSNWTYQKSNFAVTSHNNDNKKGNVKIQYMLNMCAVSFTENDDVRSQGQFQIQRTVDVQVNIRSQSTMNHDYKPKEEDEDVRRSDVKKTKMKKTQRKTSKLIAYLSIKSENCKNETCAMLCQIVRQVY